VKHTALLLIDLQSAVFNGDPLQPVHDAAGLLDRAEALLGAARAAGVPVVHVQHSGSPGEALERGAPGWPIHERLAPAAGETLVHKQQSSAFDDTELAESLERLGVDQLVVTGIQSEFCVGATCSAALERGLGVTLARDAHSTWTFGGRTAVEIIDEQNAALRERGAELAETSELVGRLAKQA